MKEKKGGKLKNSLNSCVTNVIRTWNNSHFKKNPVWGSRALVCSTVIPQTTFLWVGYTASVFSFLLWTLAPALVPLRLVPLSSFWRNLLVCGYFPWIVPAHLTAWTAKWVNHFRFKRRFCSRKPFSIKFEIILRYLCLQSWSSFTAWRCLRQSMFEHSDLSTSKPPKFLGEISATGDKKIATEDQFK